jgi:predicted aspartyl protease
MKIVGGIGESNLGFISAILIIPSLHINDPIRFYVDTGASGTVIANKDAERLGIDKTSLKPLDVHGIGGKAKCYLLPKSMLVFRFSDCMHIEYLNNAMVLDSSPRQRQNFNTPSLLGVDILKNYSIRFTNKQIILEK